MVAVLHGGAHLAQLFGGEESVVFGFLLLRGGGAVGVNLVAGVQEEVGAGVALHRLFDGGLPQRGVILFALGGTDLRVAVEEEVPLGGRSLGGEGVPAGSIGADAVDVLLARGEAGEHGVNAVHAVEVGGVDGGGDGLATLYLHHLVGGGVVEVQDRLAEVLVAPMPRKTSSMPASAAEAGPATSAVVVATAVASARKRMVVHPGRT